MSQDKKMPPNGRREKQETITEEELQAISADMLELRFLTKENAVFRRTAGGFVSLTYQEKTYDRVGVYRTFPLTDEEAFISIREADEKAREIGIVEDLKVLDKEQADMLREQLRLRYFLPQIVKIHDIKDEYGFAYFDVETNFGACRFTIRMNSSSVVSLSDHRILITDLDGNRFEIPDYWKLTPYEKKKLDLFI